MLSIRHIDMKRLRELVIQGKTVKGLEGDLHIADTAALAEALLKLLRIEFQKSDSTDPAIESAPARPKFTKRGIVISPSMLETSEFKEGDEFSLKTAEDRIVLKREFVKAFGPL